MSYRLVVCIDVDAPDLLAAYGTIYQRMSKTGLDWESSDEAFDPDGNPITEAELSKARLVYLGRVTEDFEGRCPHGMFYTGAGACPACGGDHESEETTDVESGVPGEG